MTDDAICPTCGDAHAWRLDQRCYTTYLENEVARLTAYIEDLLMVKAAHDANVKFHDEAVAYYQAMRAAEAERDAMTLARDNEYRAAAEARRRVASLEAALREANDSLCGEWCRAHHQGHVTKRILAAALSDTTPEDA